MGLYLNLAVGPRPIHQQHIETMEQYAPLEEWTLVDLYVKEDGYKNWDATTLDEVDDGSVDVILSSHFLEHTPHVKAGIILQTWHNKLKKGGLLTINVPDLAWACKQVYHYTQGKQLSGYYDRFEGEHGLLSIIYGSQSHAGEYHKSGYTEESLKKLLEGVGFINVKTELQFEGHDMQCIIAIATK